MRVVVENDTRHLLSLTEHESPDFWDGGLREGPVIGVLALLRDGFFVSY